MTGRVEVYQTADGGTIVIPGAADLINKFGAAALRVNTKGNIDLLVVSVDETLVWTSIEELQLEPYSDQEEQSDFNPRLPPN